MVEVVDRKEHEKLQQEFRDLAREVKELKSAIGAQFINGKAAKKETGKTGQKFYDFIRKYGVRTTGVLKGTRYFIPDLEMAMRIEMNNK